MKTTEGFSPDPVTVLDSLTPRLKSLDDIGYITADKHSSMCKSSTANLSVYATSARLSSGWFLGNDGEPRGRSVERSG